MRIFAIKNDTIQEKDPLGFLIYLDSSRSFYIELPSDADPWNLPPLLSSFARKSITSLDAFWSRRFVQYRIIPPDRQNINQILRKNGLNNYDEFSLLLLAMGRCEQDDCYLEELDAEQIPPFLQARWNGLVTDVLPLEVPKLLVFFRDGSARMVDVQEQNKKACDPFIASQERFNMVEVQPGGFGVYWNENATLSYRVLRLGAAVPLMLQDLHRYLQQRVVSAAQAAELLSCSRQNIDDLMRRDKLHPLRTDAKYKLFSRAEVTERVR